MAKPQSTPLTREAVTRIAKATAAKHGGQIPAKSFASYADATVQREAAKQQAKAKG